MCKRYRLFYPFYALANVQQFLVVRHKSGNVLQKCDGSLTANQSRIDDLKKELFALCEVGTVMSQEDMNSSKGYEALNVKPTNARLKVRRIHGDNYNSKQTSY